MVPKSRRAGKPGPKKSRRTCGAENTEPAQRSAQRTGTQSWPKGRWAPPALQKEVSELRALYDKKKSALHNAGRTGDAAKVEAAREALGEVAGKAHELRSDQLLKKAAKVRGQAGLTKKHLLAAQKELRLLGGKR